MEELAAILEEALRTRLAGPARRVLGKRARDLVAAFPLRDPAWWPAEKSVRKERGGHGVWGQPNYEQFV